MKVNSSLSFVKDGKKIKKQKSKINELYTTKYNGTNFETERKLKIIK